MATGQAGATAVLYQDKPWLMVPGVRDTTPNPSALGVNGIWNTTRALVAPDDTVRPALFVAVMLAVLLTHTSMSIAATCGRTAKPLKYRIR